MHEVVSVNGVSSYWTTRCPPVVGWHQVGLLLMQNVSLRGLLPCLATNFCYLMAIFLPGRKTYYFYERLYCTVHRSISDRYAIHLVHRKRKWTTVYLACPHAHSSDSAALIRRRYPFNSCHARPKLSELYTVACTAGFPCTKYFEFSLPGLLAYVQMRLSKKK